MGAKRVVAAAALAALALLPAAPALHAAPEISIRAHTQLGFDGIRRNYNGTYSASGRLTDKLTGAPLEHQRVELTINGETHVAFTDGDGRYAITLAGLTGPQDVALAFGGGPALDPSELSVAGVEVDKQPLDLALVPSPVRGGVSVAFTATSNSRPVVIRGKLFAGPADADPAKLPAIGDLTSGESMTVTRALAGGAGRRRIRVEFAGDDVYPAARAETTVELKTATKTTFTLAESTIAYEDRVAGKGTVLDEEGKGVAKAPVTLIAVAGSRRLEQTTTRADGTFRFSIEAKLLGEGAHQLQIAADAPNAFLSPSTTDPLRVVIKAPQPVPIAFTAAAFAATALVAGGFFLARSRPWDRRRREPPPADRPGAADDKGEVKGGLTQAKPGIVSTLRRASDLGVSGTVRDAVRGRALPGAVVRLRLAAPAEERSTTAADDGGFALEDLDAGDWAAKVTAPGHVSERFTLTVPHRGELRGVRIDLVPVREAVFAIYRVAAEPLLPETRLWGVWSPRQIVDHVRRQRPTAALAELTDFVEEAYFSARVPDEDILPAAQDHVDRAVRERAARNARV
jgi:hypothetical protein